VKHAIATVCILLSCSAQGRAQSDDLRLPYEPGRSEQIIDEPAYVQQDFAREWTGVEQRVVLREVDRKALAVAKQWRDAADAPSPQRGEAGRVIFPYGQVLPKIICAPLRNCRVELEPGETVSPRSVHCADQGNWSVFPAHTAGVTNVIISPKFVGLRTTLSVFTDRRVYDFELESLSEEHMPVVSFTYPPNTQKQWAEYMRSTDRETKKDAKTSTPAPKQNACDIRVDPRSLRYDYTVEKAGWWGARRKIDWAPKRVYDDGLTTTFEMPRRILSSHAPALFVTSGSGSMRPVTYQNCGTRLHLTEIFKEAMLVLSVGTKQQKVVIRRKVKD
jgi:P-type conjugative transfer protein TrbG